MSPMFTTKRSFTTLALPGAVICLLVLIGLGAACRALLTRRRRRGKD